MADAGATGTFAANEIRLRIVNAAEAARVAAAGKAYSFGGATTDGFDCSGFVVYVFNRVFGAGNPARLTAEGLRNSALFTAVSDKLRQGDLIFFSNNGETATHVGIVASAEQWIGSQSSTGVAYVRMQNTYWKPRFLCYRGHKQFFADVRKLPLRTRRPASAVA
jgi:cell wall-associated NlpC family hydrolase